MGAVLRAYMQEPTLARFSLKPASKLGGVFPLSLACPAELYQRHPKQRYSIPCAPQMKVVAIEMCSRRPGRRLAMGSTGGEA